MLGLAILAFFFVAAVAALLTITDASIRAWHELRALLRERQDDGHDWSANCESSSLRLENLSLSGFDAAMTRIAAVARASACDLAMTVAYARH